MDFGERGFRRASQGHKSAALMNNPAKAPLYLRSPDTLTLTAFRTADAC
jgi:hypothetical protein